MKNYLLNIRRWEMGREISNCETQDCVFACAILALSSFSNFSPRFLLVDGRRPLELVGRDGKSSCSVFLISVPELGEVIEVIIGVVGCG